MVEQETVQLNSKSPLGRLMIQQAASSLYFIGGLASLIGLHQIQDTLIITLAASLFVVGFFQILLVRYVLQKEPNGVQVSRVVAFIAFSLCVLLEFFIILSEIDYKTLFFLPPAVLNFMLVKRLADVKSGKPINW